MALKDDIETARGFMLETDDAGAMLAFERICAAAERAEEAEELARLMIRFIQSVEEAILRGVVTGFTAAPEIHRTQIPLNRALEPYRDALSPESQQDEQQYPICSSCRSRHPMWKGDEPWHPCE